MFNTRGSVNNKRGKMKKLIKKNYKFILGIVIGLIWSSGIAYAATILFDSDEVSYDNTTSGLSATNVQSALDELYVESTSYQLFESRVSTLESQIYPVGSIYISTTKTTASQVKALFGGTWVSVGSGKVLQGVDASHAADSTIEAGLPNITGNFALGASNGYNYEGGLVGGVVSASGAFSRYNPGGSSFYPALSQSSSVGTGAAQFNASSSNSIYGNSTTVQPPAYVVYMYKRTA